MAHDRLFRKAALCAHHNNGLGEIVLIRPISSGFWTIFAAVCGVMLAALLGFGSYTKHSTVPGQLIPDKGLVKVHAREFGIVQKKFVSEGQVVRRGDPLFILSSERLSTTQGNTQALISRHVEARVHSLRDELDKTLRLQTEERAMLVRKIDSLGAERLRLASQLSAQSNRVRLAEQTVGRYQYLVARNYVSTETLQQKQADLLDQQLRLQGLERDRISADRELSTQESELRTLPLKNLNRRAEIERLIAATGQELTESEAKRDFVVTAPESGTATAVLAEVGQVVDVNKPLVSIVPAGSHLQAHLYAPSKAIGFVKPGDSVLLRYQAYPYQKFGHAKGVVVSVSRSALPATELAGFASENQVSNAELQYRIIVALTMQTIVTYAKPQPLQSGMLLEADILQETRRLYEWVLEPLYSLTGKL